MASTPLRATPVETAHDDGIVRNDGDDGATVQKTTVAAPPVTDNVATSSELDDQQEPQQQVPLCLQEGLFGVIKPVNWTSSDVVSYIRGILERDARNRGAVVGRVGQAQGRRQRRNNGSSKKNVIRVGA